MKILMLCPLISSSSFITTYPFAKILSKKHDVEVIGPLLGKQPYIEDSKLNFTFVEPVIKKPIQLAFMSLFKKNYNIIKKKDFDVIHVFKLLPHTGPVGAKIKQDGSKFVLSIDDYDAAATKNKAKRTVLKWAEKAYKKADALTVSSEMLKKIYGGDVIYQVANEFAFRKIDASNFRKRHKLENKFVIAHAGTFFEHKGADVLIKAVKKLNNKKIRLVLAGNSNVERYKRMAGNETLFTGRLPITEVAKLTKIADIYAIPTKDTAYARAEIPAKIFEPMMTGTPIVASSISDIPKILEKGKNGMLVEPSDVVQLADAIQYLMDNPNERKKLATNAQRAYEKNFSYKSMEVKINKIYKNLE